MKRRRVYNKDEEVEKLFHCSFPFTQEAHCLTRQPEQIHNSCLLLAYMCCGVAKLQAETSTERDIHTMLTYEMNAFLSDSLWDGRSGDRIPVKSTFPATVQTGPGTIQPPV